jgi:hypothetical protein
MTINAATPAGVAPHASSDGEELREQDDAAV